MNKYMVYMDDGKDCYKIAVPADSIKDARKFVEGNGEVIKVREVNAEYPIDASKVSEALAAGGFSQTEIDFIVRTLTRTEIAE